MPFFIHTTYMYYLSKISNNNIVRSPIHIVLKKYNSYSLNVICSMGMKKKLPLLPNHWKAFVSSNSLNSCNKVTCFSQLTEWRGRLSKIPKTSTTYPKKKKKKTHLSFLLWLIPFYYMFIFLIRWENLFLD